MNCPDCGRPMWQRDEQTLTCKQGHQVPVGDAVRPSHVRARRVAWHGGTGAAAGATAAVLIELAVHLLS